MQILLENGANPDVVDETDEKQTPMHIAAERLQDQSLRGLLEAG